MATRKAPLIRCRCGRQHRSWNPHKVCNACVRESLRDRDDALLGRVRARETPAVDVDELRRVHERWLARQPADHPWRTSSAGVDIQPGHAGPSVSTAAPAVPVQLTIDATSRVAAGGGEA